VVSDLLKPTPPLTSLKLAVLSSICVAVQVAVTHHSYTNAAPQQPAASAAASGKTPSHSASGSVSITATGATVFVVNPDSGSVSAVDTRLDEKIGEVFVGADLRALALSPDDRQLYVTSQGEATLTVLDAERLAILATLRVGAEPYGVVPDPTGQFLYVASAATANVEVIDLRRAGQWHYRNWIVARIPVGAKPKGLALTASGARLYVTHFLSGEVSVIDTARREVIQVIATGNDSNMAQKIALHPTSGRAYLPHIRSNIGNRFLLFDSTVFPVVSALDTVSSESLPRERVDLSLGVAAANLPFDLAFSPAGERMYVVSLGSGDLSVVDLATRQRIARVEVGDGPRGIVVTPDGHKAYVANSLSDDVSVIDLVALREIKRIPITQSLLSAQLKRGRLLFFSSRSTETSRDRWISCATCHFDGEHDGRTWFTTLGPRNTTSMRGVGDTRPVHWSADRDEVQDFEFTIRELQAGTGLIRNGTPHPTTGTPNAGRSADLDALAAFIASLPSKTSPYRLPWPARDPDGALTLEAQRGRLIFERQDVGCANCHVPPRYTDSTLAAPFSKHDVGTGDGPDERFGPTFDTPSLRGLWDSAPYLHDGSAATLRDVLITRNPQRRHGRTSHLSEAEIRDLIAFLLSL
jgi:YVTN family beta-propeller protein